MQLYNRINEYLLKMIFVQNKFINLNLKFNKITIILRKFIKFTFISTLFLKFI